MKTIQHVQAKLHSVAHKYPLLGPGLWIVGLQYFVSQLVVAAAWPVPYDWANNLISDLGNTECALYNGLYVCSPLALFMNISFVVFGSTMVLGALLIYQQFTSTRLSMAGFILMVLSGIGTILVGLFPENTVFALHMLGAFLGLGIGNISVVLLGMSLSGLNRLFRAYTVMSGVFSLIALGFFATGLHFGIGLGGMERLVSYPFALWMFAFGAHMVTVRVRSRRTL